MFDTIFVESSETQGLLYDRYHKLPDIINSFLDQISTDIKIAERRELPDEGNENGISSKLEQFKRSVEVDMRYPEPIEVDDIRTTRKKILNVKLSTDKILDRLGQLRRRFKFGQNWISGILVKPKVYQKDTDENFQIRVNRFMRDIGRSMDWAEKVTVDLMNLADQDLNILSLVSKVYYRKFFEFGDIDSILIDNDIDNGLFESYVSGADDENEEDADKDPNDFMNSQIPNDEDDYVPVFSIVTAYDLNKANDPNIDIVQKKLIGHGKSIGFITQGDQYTHTLLSFDTSLENMYHFMATGIEQTSILTNTSFEITKSIYISATFVTKDECKIIKDRIAEMENGETAYDIFQLIGQLFGKTKHTDKQMICSTFVGYILSCGNVKNLHRDFSLIRPEDITILPRAFYVIQFRDKDDFIKRKHEFDERIAKIKADNIDEIIDYNNALPKTILKTKFKEKGAIDKFFAWLVHKLG